MALNPNGENKASLMKEIAKKLGVIKVFESSADPTLYLSGDYLEPKHPVIDPNTQVEIKPIYHHLNEIFDKINWENEKYITLDSISQTGTALGTNPCAEINPKDSSSNYMVVHPKTLDALKKLEIDELGKKWATKATKSYEKIDEENVKIKKALAKAKELSLEFDIANKAGVVTVTKNKKTKQSLGFKKSEYGIIKIFNQADGKLFHIMFSTGLTHCGLVIKESTHNPLSGVDAQLAKEQFKQFFCTCCFEAIPSSLKPAE